MIAVISLKSLRVDKPLEGVTIVDVRGSRFRAVEADCNVLAVRAGEMYRVLKNRSSDGKLTTGNMTAAEFGQVCERHEKYWAQLDEPLFFGRAAREISARHHREYSQ